MIRLPAVPPRLAALAAVAFWGLSFVATKATVASISPVALIFARSGLGSALLLAILAARREPLLPPRETWPTLAAMAFVGIAFHQTLQAFALTMTSAVNTGWLVSLSPLWTALLAAWRLKERFPGAKLAGLAIGFLGALIVVSKGRLSLEVLSLPTTGGDLLILAGTLNWAFYTTLGLDVMRRLGPTRATAGVMLLGWLMLLPLFLARSGLREYGRLGASGVAAVAFLGLCCSGLAYLFWYSALERLEASRVAAFLYLEPLITLGAAMAVLGETASLTTVMGGGLLIGGVVLVQRAR